MMQMIFDNGQRFVKLLQNRSPEASQVLFLKFCFNKDLNNFLKKLSGRSNVFIFSKFQSSLSNKFYDRNQTLQTEAIFIIFRIY